MRATRTIASALLGTCGLILVLLLVTAGAALYELHLADDAADLVSHQHLPSIASLGEASTQLERIRRTELAVTMFSDATALAKYRQDMAAAVKGFEDAMAEYESVPMDSEEVPVHESLRKHWSIYAGMAKQTLALQEAQDADGARRNLTAARTVFLDMEPEILRLLTYNKEQAGKARDAQDRAVQRAYIITACCSIVAIVIGLAIAMVLARRISRPVIAVRDALAGLADGNLAQRVETNRQDELGAMAHTLNATVDGLRATVGEITQGAHGVAGAAEELSAVSNQLAGNADTASSQSSQAASAANEVAASIGTIASGIEELSASVGEIAKNAGAAAVVGRDGVAAAGDADAAMSKLAAASSEIGDIVKLITGIAEQTNLLALNATIEAARAGDAGKGFAVVASEVKDLARRTAEATGDIGRRVGGIQGNAQAAQAALVRIRELVGQMNALQQTIASAVEEQSATTKELSGNIGQIAQAGTAIAGNAAAVATAAHEAATRAAESSKAAEELARLSAALSQSVARFRS